MRVLNLFDAKRNSTIMKKPTLDLENSVLWFIKIVNQNNENDTLPAHLREQCHSSISGSNLSRKGTTAPAMMLFSQFQFTSNHLLSKKIISRGPLKRRCVLKSTLCKNQRTDFLVHCGAILQFAPKWLKPNFYGVS